MHTPRTEDGPRTRAQEQGNNCPGLEGLQNTTWNEISPSVG